MPTPPDPTTFDDAKQYFQNNPSSIKFKKLDKTKDCSYILVNGTIYRVFNRHLEANAIIGQGGEGKVKRITTEQNQLLKVKIKHEKLIRQNQDELALEQKKGILKGIAERVLSKNGKTYSKTYKVSDYIEGNTLENEILTTKLTTTQKLIIAIKLTQAVHDLHQTLGYIHCDLKASNIIVHFPNPSNRNTIQLEIIDFGLSKQLPLGHNAVMIYSTNGTQGYIAPEISEHNVYSIASDVYALGHIFEVSLQMANSLTLCTRMKEIDRYQRLTLPQVHDFLIKLLTNQPAQDQDDETRAVINSVMQTATPTPIASITSCSNQFTSTTSFEPLLQLIPRTVQSNLMHGDNQSIDFEGITWKKITAQANLTSNTNRYWVSVGSNRTRENIFFDSQSDKMSQLAANMLLQTIDLSSTETLLRLVNQMIFQLPIQTNLQDVTGFKNVRLDELIDKKLLVCRHKALIATKLITTLIEHSKIPFGSVHCFRSNIHSASTRGAHTFATYRDHSTNDLWIIDPALKLLFNLSDSIYPYYQTYHLYATWLVGADVYGSTALLDMIKRLSYLDIYLPFITTFNAKLNEGKYPGILSAYAFENPAYSNTIELRFSFSDPARIHTFAHALAIQNISASLALLEPNILRINTQQPAFILKFNFQDFDQTLASLQLPHSLATARRKTNIASTLTKTVKNILRSNFLAAVKSNNLMTVNWLISGWMVSTVTQSHGFIQAAALGHLAILLALLEKRSLIIRFKALIEAAKCNQFGAFSILFNSIRSCEISSSMLVNLFEIAVDYDAIDILRKLLTSPLRNKCHLSNESLYLRAIEKNSMRIFNYLHNVCWSKITMAMLNQAREVATRQQNQAILSVIGTLPIPSLNTQPDRVLTYLYQPQHTQSLRLLTVGPASQDLMSNNNLGKPGVRS